MESAALALAQTCVLQKPVGQLLSRIKRFIYDTQHHGYGARLLTNTFRWKISIQENIIIIDQKRPWQAVASCLKFSRLC